MHGAKDYMLPCLNKKLLGVDCPGCGLQRSVVLVSKGEFTEAFYMFPAIYTTFLFIIAIVFHFFLKKKITSKISIAFAIINAVIMIIAYFLKMNKLILN
ncbi:DUF2752 domain-containing protein [Tenacibaculum amylolyticum]|uniref:DUF2752 domain-containing protein n=1 Tax=Tenacibaculum amylolyticum TaxID=104269 RepID=UPI00389403B1